MSENCYIFWDEERIYIQCEDCHKENNKGQLWLAEQGYGDWDIDCKCGKIIHRKEQDEQAED